MRTGRAGANGVALTLMSNADAKHARGLIKILKDAEQEVPSALQALASSGGGGQKQNRGGGGKGGGKGASRGTLNLKARVLGSTARLSR